MALIDQLQAKLQRHPKRIVFPEGNDPRILQAARQFATRRLGVPILLGDRSEIKAHAAQLDLRLDGMRLLEPDRSEDFALFLPAVRAMPRFSDCDVDGAQAILRDHNYFAALMMMHGRADAFVGGATTTASNALRPLFHVIPRQEGVNAASSMLLLDMEETKLGLNGVLLLADCGVIPEPDADQLADIAVTTADIGHHLTGQLPRVGFLSFASRPGEAAHASITRIRQAVARAREKAARRGLLAEFDGELQADAALDPGIASFKNLNDSPVAGRANVLIFPDLNAGNIASKLLLQVALARGYGQIITGLQKPCAEISRSAHAIDIFGTAILVGCQAINRQLLYGTPTQEQDNAAPTS